MAAISEDDIPALCGAVGFISINWSLMERQMDTVVHFLFARLGGVPKHPQKPVSFDKKANYLQKGFRKAPLSNFRHRLDTLVNDARALAHTRHIFMHGTITDLDGTKLKLEKLEAGSVSFEIVERTFDFLEFPGLAGKFSGLASRWIQFADDLHAAYDEGHIQP